jgi:hypothetical protein
MTAVKQKFKLCGRFRCQKKKGNGTYIEKLKFPRVIRKNNNFREELIAYFP